MVETGSSPARHCMGGFPAKMRQAKGDGARENENDYLGKMFGR